MPEILPAISCNLDAHIIQASLPLFEAGKVEALEWSFDTLFKIKEIPGWFTELLHTYSNANRLIGHGVYFSLFSGKWLPEQQQWLQYLEQVSKQFTFDHITEHFGFVTGKNFHVGAPLSIPFTPTTLAIGQDRLKRIYNACKCPVGLENLAFAYTMEDVKMHGGFLQQLLQQVNGFIILDIHNLYCQLHNFNLAFDDLLACYPLEMVREMHISGGSWEDSVTTPGRKIRRDTHDECVSEEVFEMLEKAINKCPNVKYVVLEQLGNALHTDESQALFREDYMRVSNLLKNVNQRYSLAEINSFLPLKEIHTNGVIEDAQLYQQQCELSDIFESATSYNNAMQMLYEKGFGNSDWQIEKWQPYMLETAISIAQKWKRGFE